MVDLATTQRLISAALGDSERSDAVLPLITGAPDHAQERLAVYRANVNANAALALAATYPIVHKLVGAEFFDGLAREYSSARPSHSGDLNERGNYFAEFLQTFQPAQTLPYLPDVARMEWLAHQAHYAADHAPLDVGKLASISQQDYPRLALTLHAAVAMLTAAFPLFRIWEVHQDDYRGEVTVEFDGATESIVVYRPNFRTAVARLTHGEAVFLDSIKSGNLLGPALDLALAADNGFDFAATLQRWVASNIVVRIDAAT